MLTSRYCIEYKQRVIIKIIRKAFLHYVKNKTKIINCPVHFCIKKHQMHVVTNYLNSNNIYLIVFFLALP